MTSVIVRGMDRAGRPLDGRVTFLKEGGTRASCNLTAGRCFLQLMGGPYTVMFAPVREKAPPPRVVIVPRTGTITVTVRSRSVSVYLSRPLVASALFRPLGATPSDDFTPMSVEQASILFEATLEELDSATEPRPDLAVRAAELTSQGIAMSEGWPRTGNLSPEQHSAFSSWISSVMDLMAIAYGRRPSSWWIPVGLIAGGLAVGYFLTR